MSACSQLNVNSDQSQPEIHETNGIIEKYNQHVLDGTRVLLVQAGLPPVFWPYAATCYCMLSNIMDKAPNEDLFPGTVQVACQNWCCIHWARYTFWVSGLLLADHKQVHNIKSCTKTASGHIHGIQTSDTSNMERRICDYRHGCVHQQQPGN